MIYIIRKEATKEEIKEMLKILGSYVKVAVDIKREILAGGGERTMEIEDAKRTEVREIIKKRLKA